MEFRILGPFEVSERGQPLELGAGKQRALLALLLLRAGEVVSTDRLIDALWAERPPASALNSVHIYVSQLRKALGNGRLKTRGHGYLLALELEQLDLGRFERLLGEGRALLAAGEPERAAEGLRAALALWRGPPLSDFASEPFAQAEIARLEELRLAALEERIEADLALGRHAELVSELEALVREHPLRERLRAQLMLALYRSGRQAEALDTYQRARRVLAEELGLEPGRTLQELEGAILRQDAELDAPGRTPAMSVKTPRRGGVLIAIGAVLLLTAAIAVAGIELTRGGNPGLSSASANSVAAINARSDRLVAEVPVGNGPTSVAVGEGSVWVANARDRTVSRIDPRTGLVQRIDVRGDPSGIAIGAGAVWVANSLDGTVSRIDPQTNREVQAIPVGVTPTALAVGGGAVWVTSAEERSVTRIDVVRGRVVDTIATGALGRGIAVGGGSVWVTDESSRSVVRLDSRRASVVETVSVGNGPTGVAFGDGSVWVANSLDGTVSRIDPSTGSVTATIQVGEGPDGIAVGPDAVWVSVEFSETIARIDPAENRVVEQVPIANRPKGLALSGNQVWFAVQSSGAGHRGGRLVVASGEFISGPIDPTFTYWTGTWSSLSTTYDGLVGYARRGGSEGAQIVPNLALSLPVITAGDTRYSFRLRRGVRYSNGTLVKASDFRRAFERALRGGLPLEVPLVGADACKRRPRGCDLSRGIRTDDATGTIVFHLLRPEGRFLRDLVSLSVPIPRGTPDRDLGTRPLPSTGPYMIESYVPGRALTLVRNPYFRVRSRAARPDGFPDEIKFRLGVLSAGVTAAVERGRVDVAFVPSDHKDVKALEDFKARYASQFHLHTEQATVGLFLNTTQPPFDDVRVRKAVNYAVDRAAISASYGPGFAQPTCQPRPPGTVGFRRYCPYTAAPTQTGEWNAPDLTRARRLVANSGTRGMNVTIWTYPGFWEQAAEGAVRALKELGYRASIRRAEGPDAYFARAADEKTRGVQAGMSGLYGVPRAGSSLLTLLRCTPPDLSFFCDRRVDAQIARALRVEATDPDAAVARWAKIERDIVDLAPWVPLFTPSHAFLTSKRVGNYQYNPESRLLFDQLWVR
jgi:YVTN family beta-propeller protein